jgi:hypothetical protein
MHPCIRFILLFLTYLPYAFSTPQSNLTRQAGKCTGCHKSISPAHTFLFFRTDNEPDFDFAIKTEYTTYYPKALESALRLDYFRPLILSTRNECGWKKAKSVHSRSWGEAGRHRGDVYWKYSDLHWVSPNNSGRDAHWIAASADHVPPRTSIEPKNDTLGRISRILTSNEPAADVYQLATICLGYFCGLLCMLCILLFVRLWVDAISKADGAGDPEAIELATIAGESAAKTETASEANSAVEVPQNPGNTHRGWNTQGLRTPPPQYSFDGPHR